MIDDPSPNTSHTAASADSDATPSARLWTREVTSSHREASPPTDRPLRGPLRGVLMLLAVAAVVGILAWGLRSLVPDTPLLELELQGRVALVPFANATGESEHDWVARGLMPMVAEALSRTPGVDVVPPHRLLKLTAERGLVPGVEGASQRIRELAFALGAEVVVEATLRDSGARTETLEPLSGDGPPRLQLDVAVHRPGGVSEQGTLRATDPLTLANLLVVSLGRGLDSSSEPVRLERIYTSSGFLARLYGMGLHTLATRDSAAARPYFEVATEHRPYFLAARLALARCARELGDAGRAAEETRSTLEEAQARGDRWLQVEALTEQALQTAIEGNQAAAGELYAQAGSILVTLDDDSRRSAVLFEIARLAMARNDLETASRLFEDRLTLQRRLGDQPGQVDTLIELATLDLRADAQGAGGEAASARLDEARLVAEAVDDLWLRMQVVASRGEVERRRGQTDEAVALWAEALAFYRQQGDVPRQLLLANRLTEAHLEARDYDAAEDLLNETLEMTRAAEQPALEASASLRLAWLLLRTGYPRQARTHIDRALELDRWIVEDRRPLQLVIAWLAYEQGNFRLALDTQLETKRQAPERWRPLDEAFLRVFRRALTVGERLPVPGEEEALGSSGPLPTGG